MQENASLTASKCILVIHLKISVSVLYLTSRELPSNQPQVRPTHFATFLDVSVSRVSVSAAPSKQHPLTAFGGFF